MTDSIEAAWLRLNDAKLSADAKFDSWPIRDMAEHPWTAEDSYNHSRSTTILSSYIARIEERQQVLYWQLLEVRKSARSTERWLGVIVAILIASLIDLIIRR